MTTKGFDLAIIGSGVLGAFHAYSASSMSLQCILLEKARQPNAASVRNFGMVIPSGMPPGQWQSYGTISTGIYRTLAEELGFAVLHHGSQYVANEPSQLLVLQEFAQLGPEQGYQCSFLDQNASLECNPILQKESCLGSVLFPNDLRFDPRELMAKLLQHLDSSDHCQYQSTTLVTSVRRVGNSCVITTSGGEVYHANQVIICSGSDVQTLFPEVFATLGLVHCKLYMSRTAPMPKNLLKTALATGYSIGRYGSFSICPSWSKLAQELPPAIKKYGIHVLAAQDANGQVVLGDSHEYSTDFPSDFWHTELELQLQKEYEKCFHFPHWNIAEKWHGVYTLHPDRPIIRLTIDDKIHVITGLGGKGMTTSPALAQETISQLSTNSYNSEKHVSHMAGISNPIG